MHRVRRSSLALLAVVVLAACAGETTSPAVDDVAASGSTPPVASTTDDATPTPTPTPTDDPATPSPSDDQASASDEPSSAPTGSAAPAAPSCTLTDEDAGVQVLAPVPGATVPSSFTIEGCGNTFEATYLWEVTLDDGTVAGGGFGTMTCGTGCVGTFEDDVTVDGAGDATLRVFEEDARDGGRTNVVEVPLTIAP